MSLIFRRLVLGCIDSYDSEKWRIFSHFSRSTRFSRFRTALNATFQQIFLTFSRNFNKFCKISEFFARFWQKWWIFLNFWVRSGAKAWKSCRSRKMWKNAPFLVIVAVDTAENGPSKDLWKSVKSGLDLAPSGGDAAAGAATTDTGLTRGRPRHMTLF